MYMDNKKYLGHFFIIVGPSGVGKNTLIQKYMKENPNKIIFPVSATTRKKREGKIEGINYYFLSIEEFKEKIKKNEFIEWALVFDNYYGTIEKKVLLSLEKGDLLMKDIDIQGALNLKSKLKDDATCIFISPKSIKDLEKRIRDRGLDEENAIQKRLKDAKKELENSNKFENIIINDTLDKAYEEFKKIINERICLEK